MVSRREEKKFGSRVVRKKFDVPECVGKEVKLKTFCTGKVSSERQ